MARKQEPRIATVGGPAESGKLSFLKEYAIAAGGNYNVIDGLSISLDDIGQGMPYWRQDVPQVVIVDHGTAGPVAHALAKWFQDTAHPKSILVFVTHHTGGTFFHPGVPHAVPA